MTEDQSPSVLDDLLLACARVELDPASSRLLGRLPDLDIDWEHLAAVAVRQGIAVLLYSHLQTLGARSAVTPAAWARLENTYLAAALVAMRQRAELNRLVGLLETTDTPIITLKGLHLSESVYPDPALRPCNDIDLLARGEDVPEIERALVQLGYHPDEREHSRSWYRPSVVQHLIPYVSPVHDVRVEVHWSLAPPQGGFSIDVEGLWARRDEATIAGRNVGVLAPTDLLLYLALHVSGVHRLWTDLRHLVDIAEVVQRLEGRLDEEEIVSRAADWGARRHVYAAFMLARDLVGAPFPDRFLQTLHPEPIDQRFVSLARARVLTHGMPEPVAGPCEGLPVLARTGQDLNGLVAMMRGVFPSRKQMARIYGSHPGSPWIYGHYLLRPVVLLTQHRRLLLHLLSGTEAHRDELMAHVAEMELDEWLDLAPH